MRGDFEGRHTTTHRERVPLPDGGLLVDTPGMRGLAVWDADEGIDRALQRHRATDQPVLLPVLHPRCGTGPGRARHRHRGRAG
ncbi:GTPase RsgA [Streptomyces sp. 4N124]|uniref:GTPase RsgA n=1 Tax=Streptomyces sp. 4N124 TaxID=3457420 RepID=UPI003FD1A49D